MRLLRIFCSVVEDDLLIETVEKLWFKHFLGSFENLIAHAFIVIFTCRHGGETETVLALDEFCTRIRSQDNDRIPEIDLSTKVIRYSSLFQYLDVHIVCKEGQDISQIDAGRVRNAATAGQAKTRLAAIEAELNKLQCKGICLDACVNWNGSCQNVV